MKSAFDREADAAYARLIREPCGICGATYSAKLGRRWHEPSCPVWRRPPRSQSIVDQDREREELTARYIDPRHHIDPDTCKHGTEPASACPVCSEVTA